MNIIGVIPARYASTRFPGKPLININGKSMIQRVYEQARKAKLLSELVIATDDKRIFDHVKSFSGNVIMTGTHHQNGTERCAEALTLNEGAFDGIINIQGDEPFIQPQQIDLVAGCLIEENTEIATLVKSIDNLDEYQKASVVKVIVDKNFKALYFSRSPVPYVRPGVKENAIKHHILFKHIGIYGFKTNILQEIVRLPKSNLEEMESLEQLRWLENGYKIFVKETGFKSIAIDTPEDYQDFEEL